MYFGQFYDPIAKTSQDARIEDPRTYHEHAPQGYGGRMIESRKTFLWIQDAGNNKEGHYNNGCGIYGKIILYEQDDSYTDDHNGNNQITAHIARNLEFYSLFGHLFFCAGSTMVRE